MKKTILLLFIISSSVTAQDRFITKSGLVAFEASVPSFEEVAAENNSVTAILNSDNGEIASLALVKGFRFKNALMEEHFNENYAESDQFPKSTFKGKIENFNPQEITSDPKVFKINGTLEFKGKESLLNNIPITISKEGNSFLIKGNFKVNVAQFDIEIPKIVSNKISDEVDVNFQFKLIQQ